MEKLKQTLLTKGNKKKKQITTSFSTEVNANMLDFIQRTKAGEKQVVMLNNN